MEHMLVTTANSLEGYRITKQLGVVRGLTVRSRSIFGTLAGQLQSLAGGELSIYMELCEKARNEAYVHLLEHAAAVGANAIVAMRYDANEVDNHITEVLAYGTAVFVESM
jgi:uncharacterized protein YbjQ (UPF0145 family)